MKPLSDIERAANEIYLLIRGHNGAIAAISQNVGNKDSSKLSRQISISDDRRDNPFTEVLEILIDGAIPFSPALAKQIWQVLEREWSKHQSDGEKRTAQVAELINKVFPELGDVVFCCNTNASQADKEREAFQLLKAVEELYEEIKKEGERK